MIWILDFLASCTCDFLCFLFFIFVCLVQFNRLSWSWLSVHPNKRERGRVMKPQSSNQSSSIHNSLTIINRWCCSWCTFDPSHTSVLSFFLSSSRVWLIELMWSITDGDKLWSMLRLLVLLMRDLLLGSDGFGIEVGFIASMLCCSKGCEWKIEWETRELKITDKMSCGASRY